MTRKESIYYSEHTDYNEGFVLPGAVDRAVIFVVAPTRKPDWRAPPQSVTAQGVDCSL